MRRVAVVLAAAAVALARPAAADEESDIIALLAKGTPETIKAAATKTAEADIAAGHPRVAIAGTEAPMAVGFPSGADDVLRGVSTVPLPIGCTEALAHQAMSYAQAYNHVIYPYLAKREAVRRDLVAWVRMREPHRQWSSEWSWWFGPRDDDIAWCRYW